MSAKINNKKKHLIILTSILYILMAISLFVYKNIDFNNEAYAFSYEDYDIKKMSPAKITTIEKSKDILFVATVKNKVTNSLKEVIMESVSKEKSKENQKINWRLPTQQGYITQYPSNNHVALDITSARGANEVIYPIADGIITGILYDPAGAKIVTISHYINNQYYTSEYVHMSWFAKEIYVGKKVTTNDIIGGMGATGIATGIHLHITVLDCNLYDPNDSNCQTLAAFYEYGRIRLSQGFYGLQSLINVPNSWYAR